MSKKCFLCKSSEDNELLFGKFYTKWKLTVHYYCLLLSSNLVQRGSNDTVGIFGFLESDIRKENERTKKCRCYICKNMHANVSCCSKKCLRTFHTACGIMNGCLSHYTDTYQSWCSAHVPLDPDTAPHTREEPCSICYDEMGQYDVITSIKAPCCRNGWFHQGCVAQYAQSAGYFFKCPLCKNEDKFLAEIPLRGVFVPERDAAWELEPNAFQEQLLRPTACDADDCKCREGRNVDNRQWRLVVCGSCGSTCRHRQCMEQPVEGTRTYLCQLCRPVLGDRVAALENTDDSDDSSEDDTSSSGNEMIGNNRRLAIARKALLDDSDSEQSDGSSVEIRRCIRQNTGKRVRRLLSDGSENEESIRTGQTRIHSSSDDLSGPDVCKPLEYSPSMRLNRASLARETDENSSSSDRSKADVGSTRQLRRRLSSQSDSSKRSTSTTNTEELEPKRCVTRRARIDSSSDDFLKRSEYGKPNSHATGDLSSCKERYPSRQRDNKTKSSNQTRRPRLSSSSDDFEKRSESGKHNSHETDDLSKHKERYSTRQRNNKPTSSNQTRRPRLSSSSDDVEKRSNQSNDAMKNTKSVQEETNSSSEQGQSMNPAQSNDRSSSIASKRWDENSNMTDQSPLVSEKGESANGSDTSLENETVATRSMRQLTSRRSVSEASKRSTSESSIETIRPKRIGAARISSLFDDSDKRTDDSENGTTDMVDSAPQTKRRRLTRARCNKTNQNPSTTTERHKHPSISPPSTPSSLASESSEQSVVSNRNSGKRGVTKQGKQTGSGGTLNLQQQSMLQFLTFSACKSAATSDSSDQSMEETVSPSRWSSKFGSSNKINSKISPISNKRATATKRRRTQSPQKSNNRSHNEPKPESAPTSSNTASVQPRKSNEQIVRKDKGQKNILNYFNRY